MFNLLKSLWSFFIYKMKDNSGNIQKMLTPPKSKDPWTAMTKGSTGGWAKQFAKPATLLPAAAALAAIPATGWLSGAFLPQLAALGATGGLIGGVQGATTGLWGEPGTSSALKGAGMGALQGAGVSGLGQAAGKIGSAFASSQGGGVGAGAASSPGSFGAWGTSQMPNYAQNFANATGGSLSSAFNPYSVADATSKGINWGQVAGGLGTALAPTLMGGQTPQVPQSELFGEATSRLLGGQGISDIGKLGLEKLTSNLSGEFSPVSDEYYAASTRRLDEAYDKAEKDFTTQFQSIRPGADVSSDSAYREGINKLRQDRAREKSGLAAELDYRREADYFDRQYQNIQSALGVDQQTMQNYMALAQMDANQLAMNTGITLGEAAQFKEIFGNLGGYLMQKGLGLNDPFSALKSLMGGRG